MNAVLSFKPSDTRMIAELSEENFSLVERNDVHLFMNEFGSSALKIGPVAKRLSGKLKEIGVSHCRMLTKQNAIEIFIPVALDDKDGAFRACVLSVVETHCKACIDRFKFSKSKLRNSKNIFVAEEFADAAKAFDIADLEMPSPNRFNGRSGI